ncbi:MAG TPA: hypothetical protein DCL77_06815 [Prolixibacteraceae bacterium]|jgi:hypothetical protein|nr:hypothetical protein [Prolixibacteraceae bacterium]
MNREEINKVVKYGWIFLIIGLIINYLYRMVCYSIPLENIILGGDVEGYYQYLVHFFIRDWALFDRMPWTIPYGEGKTLSVFTCGLAILWSPFFLMAHFFSLFFGLDTDGYANMYYGFIQIAGIIYTYIGLVFMYKFLREFFEHRVSLITTALFFLATNIFFYSVLRGVGMAHVYSFSMIAIYLYYCHRFFKDHSLKNLILLGIPFAMAVLIRPTNLISGLYFFLYGVNNFTNLKERLSFWVQNYWAVIVLFIIGVIVFIPQMAYWHFVTGKFIVYSYQNYGFPFWTAPKIGIVLFGKYNGWFPYTPIVLFALTGLFMQLRRKEMNSLAVLIIFILCIYINASWWFPTFGAAVGQRAMIDFLPFLAVPLALVIGQIRGMSQQLRVVFGVVILILIIYNIRFGFRYDSWAWWDSPMSLTKFWKTISF